MPDPIAPMVRDAVFWFDDQVAPLPPLSGAANADVAIVGGGMMGLMCALMLTARGRTVCLLEADVCGGGASGRSSGFITPDSELELSDIVQHFGATDARRLWDFARGGVTAIRDAIATHGIACDFQPQDSLFVATSRGGAQVTEREHATHQQLGYESRIYGKEDLMAVLGATHFAGAFRFGDTFGIDAYRCCAGLRRVLLQAGARVFEHSRVTRLGPNRVETSAGSVEAAQVAVCLDRFLPSLGLARSEIYHAQTFLGISQPLPDAIIDRMFPTGPLMVWDTDLTYGYFRITGDRRLLVGGSTLAETYARHERHCPGPVATRLRRYVRRHFPYLDVTFAAAWPGLIGISKDFAPVIGQHPEHASVHFAAGAAGLPWAAALGRYLAEKILNGRDDLDEALSVDRPFPIGRRWQRLLGTPVAFALSHGIAKYMAK